jgi:endonuclease/exonuclease/phosphatase family metal-dependent hydrolase
MRKIISALFSPLLLMAALSATAQDEVSVMSFNIRLDVASDGENRWDARKEKVTGLMRFYAPDFIGTQEVMHHQLLFIRQELKGYAHIGIGRDDGKEKGEYSAIFYDSMKFIVKEQATFWLSPTPDTVSKAWGANINRICTYGLFQSKKTKKYFWVFNTHFDHQSVLARAESAKLIMTKIAALNKEKQYLVIFTGDLNAQPTEEPVIHVASVMDNTRDISQQPPYGGIDTWNAFQFSKKPSGCIDYIFVSRNNGWQVKKFATLTDSYDMKYPSDHFPVLAELVLKKRHRRIQ